MSPNTPKRKYTITITVDNESGVLARVVGLFSSCLYNIDSLNVSKINHKENTSKITLTTNSNEKELCQIKKQLAKLVPVRGVKIVSEMEKSIEKELAFFKIAPGLKEGFSSLLGGTRGELIHEGADACFFQVLEKSEIIDELMKTVEIMDISRTGVLAID
ncbi:MAG: acetolactate synthase small subunit [Lactobacillales bacterium]|jgi:acetolactate synthase-1/3 small subunit|nr:acetolactate synthase small subunit [Lactobacillales bacterium]